MITLDQIRAIASNEDNIQLTLHVLDRCMKRGIDTDDIKNVIINGVIIEQYPNDYPFPSCLELGLTLNGEPLHVCIGVGDGRIFVITAYFPDKDKWSEGFKERKDKMI